VRKLRLSQLLSNTPYVGGSSLTSDIAPTISGIPREGETASIGSGSWLGAVPNLFRYSLYLDGALVTGFPVTTIEENVEYDWLAADKYKLATAFVAASADSGATWTAPVECYYAFYPDTQLIEPASIVPDISITRTSAAGAPLTFDVYGTVLPSYVWQIYIYDGATYTTQTYEGLKPVTETELASPRTPDFSGAFGPAPDPAMPAQGTTDILVMRFVTQDWLESSNIADNAGKASPWVAVSATDFGGSQYYKLAIADAVGGVDGGMILSSLELAESSGGPDIAMRKNYFWSPGHYTPDQVGGGTFTSEHIFDGSPATKGGLNNTASLPGYIVVDLLVSRPVSEMRLRDAVSNYLSAPLDISYGPCLANFAFVGTPFTASGIPWSNSVDETRTFNLSVSSHILRSDGASSILRSDGASKLLRA
jgi:hypothetical protein